MYSKSEYGEGICQFFNELSCDMIYVKLALRTMITQLHSVALMSKEFAMKY